MRKIRNKDTPARKKNLIVFRSSLLISAAASHNSNTSMFRTFFRYQRNFIKNEQRVIVLVLSRDGPKKHSTFHSAVYDT